MTGAELKQARKRSGQTQIEAAAALGVSQTYLSLMEKGRRPVSGELNRKAVKVLSLSPVEMPFTTDLWNSLPATNAKLAADLAALGYPGFAHLKPGHLRNPAEVLIGALSAADLEARLVEALPWVVLKYPGLDWKELIMAAKVKDIQNRLGFIVNVARQYAEENGDRKTATFLMGKEAELERSRLLKEDTLCEKGMTRAEERWHRERQSDTAKRWRLLTDLSTRNFDHYDGVLIPGEEPTSVILHNLGSGEEVQLDVRPGGSPQ